MIHSNDILTFSWCLPAVGNCEELLAFSRWQLTIGWAFPVFRISNVLVYIIVGTVGCGKYCSAISIWRQHVHVSHHSHLISPLLLVKKAEHLYSALHGTYHFKALRHGSHSLTCKERHAFLYLVSIHQMAPPLNVVANI